MFKFPPIEPVVDIINVPGAAFTLTCRDAQSLFILLELGAEEEFAFYDYPSDHHDRLVFSGAHRARTSQHMRIDAIDVLLIEAWYAEAGTDYSGQSAKWHRVISEEGLSREIIIETAGEDPWTYRAGTTSPHPTQLFVGLKAEGIEPAFTTGIAPASIVNWQLEVMNRVKLAIGANSYQCLRVIIAYGKSGDPTLNQSLLEYYVAENGRTVLARRYNSPAANNYADLAGNPELEFHGLSWRHWYDTIPEHALIISA